MESPRGKKQIGLVSLGIFLPQDKTFFFQNYPVAWLLG
jgi:hypothetical protein